MQTRGRTSLLLPAEHVADGIEFLGPPLEVEDWAGEFPAHLYDARLTILDDRIYAVVACDFPGGRCHLATLVSDDFEHWSQLALHDELDARNGVLFPERIGGYFHRLERPNRAADPGEPPSGEQISISVSEDLVRWTPKATVVEGRPQRWDERIGSGPPPLKTREGWLHVYHGVATHFAASNIYQAGVLLLDLERPQECLARGAFNILEPREPWELTGQVPNVVFPSGMIVDDVDADGFAEPNSRVRIYYGAADTVVGLAETTIAELIDDARYAG